MIAGRRGHRIPAIGARLADGRHRCGTADVSHGCAGLLENVSLAFQQPKPIDAVRGAETANIFAATF
jgi:hypothetical protein